MLDEEEFERVAALLIQCFDPTRKFRKTHGIRRKDVNMRDEFRPALDLYQQITGYRETNHNAVWHHRISKYGPACSECGRPLRSSRARRCAECGANPGGQS